MYDISKKSITCGIILLFIGVSISSGISIDTKTTQVDDCDCEEKSESGICLILQFIVESYQLSLSILWIKLRDMGLDPGLVDIIITLITYPVIPFVILAGRLDCEFMDYYQPRLLKSILNN